MDFSKQQTVNEPAAPLHCSRCSQSLGIRYYKAGPGGLDDKGLWLSPLFVAVLPSCNCNHGIVPAHWQEYQWHEVPKHITQKAEEIDKLNGVCRFCNTPLATSYAWVEIPNRDGFFSCWQLHCKCGQVAVPDLGMPDPIPVTEPEAVLL